MACMKSGVFCDCRLTGCFAFGSKKSPDLETRITRGTYNCGNVHYVKLSRECKNVIACMLCVVQQQRPSAAEILQHPWFTGTSLPTVSIPTIAEMNVIEKEVPVNSVSRRERRDMIDRK